ncbi:DUF1672 family protein [Rossellomorea vietnamensis]|uniref:DUF1672 family protein n=1 Tax=Rossellomorea vietnamensis TaxID=218284 RepID=UPI001E39D96F|nr:DUF1672 family protein [Rossellomorea vietnamensis]MCC5804333.1 DUF1672 family protein [Rossellomorea vietnamensis]
MARKMRRFILGLGLTLLLSGCMNTVSENTQDELEDQYASVQEYKGEGYALENGKKNDKMATKHRGEIEGAVKTFFLDRYHTKVKVHNIVGNMEGATVFIESTGPLSFYSYAMVPITGGEVQTDEVWSQEGQVESAITDGLYQQMFDEEFRQLDRFLESFVMEGGVVGRTVESLGNVGGDGYMTPYYFISTSPLEDEAIRPVFNLYMKAPDSSIEELRTVFKEEAFNPENVRISIMLFMKEEGVQPSEKVFKQLIKNVETLDGIPKGAYSIFINDNRVHKESYEGVKDNSLERAYPNEIIKK